MRGIRRTRDRHTMGPAISPLTRMPSQGLYVGGLVWYYADRRSPLRRGQ
jgi:hypothetical protein